MQSILGIDFSITPCELCLVDAEGGRLHLKSRQTVDLGLIGDVKQLCLPTLSSLLQAIRRSQSSAEPAAAESSDDEAALKNQVLEGIERLKKGIRELNGEWSASVVIMPPYEHVSLNLNLPFGDTKMLDRVIDLEVQDVVPFELDEFSVQHSPLGHFERSDGSLTPADDQPPYDIHVGLIPRTFVANILALCKASGVEPNILTVPSSAVGSVYHLGKSFFSDNSAVIFRREDDFAVAVYIKGQVRVEKHVRAANIAQGTTDKRVSYTALKLLLAAAERRYGAKIEKLFFLGSEPLDPTLQQVLGRPIEPLSASDFLSSENRSESISALSAVFARDDDPPAPLSNFRSREFSFTPTLGEFFRGLLAARRQVLNAVLSVVVCCAGIYFAREYNLSRSRDALVEQIQVVIPEFNPGEGDIRAALIKSETKLSDDLGVLGPVAKVTPLDALLEIIRLIPPDGIVISSIKVTGNRAFIAGTAPKLAAIEPIGDALRASKGFFSKVTTNPGTSVGSRYNFTIEAVLGQ